MKKYELRNKAGKLSMSENTVRKKENLVLHELYSVLLVKMSHVFCYLEN
jgi:hypothetical protein